MGEFQADIQRGAQSVSIRPLDTVTGGASGSYSCAIKTGQMAAGLAGASEILQFRLGSTATVDALVRSVRITASSDDTGFTAGYVILDLFAARSFTVAGSGGTAATLTGDKQKRYTSGMATCAATIRGASTATLTAGTETLDTQPLASITCGVTNATFTPFIGTAGNPVELFGRAAEEYPLRISASEGFVLKITVPATGTWRASIVIHWDEVPSGKNF